MNQPARSAEIEPVRWGILGTAGIARAQVLPAMRHSQWSRVVAIASRDQEKARVAAEELSIERAYGSYGELLADPQIEAVYIPLPNHLHVPWSVRATDAGKHVLCEKPIALSAGQARELLAARDRSGVHVGEAFMVRVHPQWLAVRKLVHAGRIGALRLVTCHFSYFKDDPDNIRNRPDYGGGSLMDVGCYPITLSRWLFGAEPREVLALMEWDPVMKIDRLTSGLLHFERGQASFTCATQLAAYQRMHVFGTAGRIEVDIPFNGPADAPCRIFVATGRERTLETIEFPAVDQYTLQADEFSKAVRGLGPVPVPLEDAIGNMEVIDALFSSAETRDWAQVGG
ncbi:MAG TPA: Gfo/Idh/MocA family oxidoreductase [Gemmatimonadaceae bacterium]|nr:Gfo/Idh/MocA family oxidoreductase [Gemmatimonadaceae bacterium]